MDRAATEYESMVEFARNAGADDPARAWILTPQDVWMKNPHYSGAPVPHPEDYGYTDNDDVRGSRSWGEYIDDEIPFFCW